MYSRDYEFFFEISVSQNNKGNRRSNVVLEVEKLKKNREERRQRQAELKEEKEALMNLDPGNPNWEFLAMIRYILVSKLSTCASTVERALKRVFFFS